MTCRVPAASLPAIFKGKGNQWIKGLSSDEGSGRYNANPTGIKLSVGGGRSRGSYTDDSVSIRLRQ